MPISEGMIQSSPYQQQEEGRGLTASALFVPYSPKCVEYRILRTSPLRSSRKLAERVVLRRCRALPNSG